MNYNAKKGIKKITDTNYLNKWITKLFLKYICEYYKTNIYTKSAYQYSYEKVIEYFKKLHKKA